MPKRSYRTEDEGDGIAVDVGARIHEARTKAGLTLAQLGGDELSRSFLSLVENGKARISIRSLQILADRLGMPISAFFSDNVTARSQAADIELSHAEIALLNDEPQSALQLIDRADVPNEAQARALWLRGWAHLHRNEIREAERALRAALAAVNDREDPILIDIYYRLGRTLYRKRDYKEAEDCFEEGTALARRADDRAMIGRFSVLRGHLHIVREDYDAALAFYDAAEDTLDRVRDVNLLAASYAGKSRVYRERGNMPEAVRYAHLSLAIYAARNRQRESVAELNNLALIFQAGGIAQRGLVIIDDAVQRAEVQGWTDLAAATRSTRASLLFDLGRIDEAETDAQAVFTLASDKPDDPSSRVWAGVILGDIAERRGDRDAADQHYRAALELVERSDQNALFATIASRYGHVLRARGDGMAAADWLSAAQARMPAFNQRQLM